MPLFWYLPMIILSGMMGLQPQVRPVPIKRDKK